MQEYLERYWTDERRKKFGKKDQIQNYMKCKKIYKQRDSRDSRMVNNIDWKRFEETRIREKSQKKWGEVVQEDLENKQIMQWTEGPEKV